MKHKILTSGPKKGPLFLLAAALMILAVPPTAAAALGTAGVRSGLNEFLVDLYTNHRLLYAVVVTVGTALLGLILSLVMGWLLRILRIDRMR